jgi:hypothetical protein
MKQPKTIMKTGSNSEEFEVENPDYKKRWKPTNVQPKKKKRK